MTMTNEYFGGCPECGRSDGYVNVERVHIGLCVEHKVAWRIGENVFSCWKGETETTWRDNLAMLADYHEVEPVRSDAA
jgi:hypothetical protein